MGLCCLLMLAISALAFQPPPGLGTDALKTGAVEGRVVELATGEAVPGAKVTLVPIPIVMGIRPSGGVMGDSFYDPSQMPASRMGHAPPTVLMTDADGGFRSALTPGRYQIRAEREGYVPVPAGVTVFSLIPGERLKGVALKLNPVAAISGRAVGADGKPLGQVRIDCLKWTLWGNQSRRVLIPQASTLTNEQGEYQVGGLTPGQYLLTATLLNGIAAAPARAVDITPGLIRPGVDFRMASVPVVEVSGKVALAQITSAQIAHKQPGGVVVTLLPRDPSRLLSITRHHAAAVDADGSFILRDVPAGAYVLSAAQSQPPRSGRQNLDVADQRIAGLTLALETGAPVRGQVRVKGESPLGLFFDQITVFFAPQSSAFAGSFTSQVDTDGHFAVGPLTRESFQITASGLPRGYYVQSVQMNGIHTPDILALGEGPVGVIIVILEEGTAEVSGKVLAKGAKPLGDVQVLAVNARGEIVRSAITVIDGQYRIADLPPGEYRLFPVVDADITDPQVFERLLATATKLTLAPSSSETRHLFVR